MAPISVGIVGLPAIDPNIRYRGGNWGIQHLNALRASPQYEITAVCNSSLESAQKSIQMHNLAGATPYGKADDLAVDPNVDLVVVSVHINQHYNVIKPALLHKKNVYAEFPLAPSVEQAEELLGLAKKAGVKIIVGAQVVADPSTQKLQELLQSKVIGDVLFSSFSASIPFSTANGVDHATAAFLDYDSPIARNMIIAGHILSSHVHLLGTFETAHTVFKVVNKTSKTFDQDMNIVESERKTTAPDTILVQGVLSNGAASSFTLRTAIPPVDDVGFRWVITGTEGELVLTQGPGIIQSGSANPKIITRKWGQEANVVDIDDKADPAWLQYVAPSAGTIARVYNFFATGKETGYLSVGDGIKVQKLLENMRKNAVWAP